MAPTNAASHDQPLRRASRGVRARAQTAAADRAAAAMAAAAVARLAWPGGSRYRWTRQRQHVIDVLRESRIHLDAEEIYLLARDRDRRLSLSTVYRTLAILRDHHLVHELRLGEGHHHYEYGVGDGRLPDHAHIVCRACAKVVEFASPGLEHLQRDLRERFGFHFQGADVEIAALCDDCLATSVVPDAVPAAS